MKRTILVTLTLLLLCFVSFAQSKRNQPSPSPSPTPQTILLEDSTVIEKMIRNYSKAISDFARSGNVDSITKFYAPGYNEVSDGEERTLSETK